MFEKEISTQKTKDQTFLSAQVSHTNRQSIWLKDGDTITVSARVNIVTDGKIHKLEIKSPRLQDVGEYMLMVDHLACSHQFVLEGMKTNLLHCHYGKTQRLVVL